MNQTIDKFILIGLLLVAATLAVPIHETNANDIEDCQGDILIDGTCGPE